jgi:hypothetical protein
VAFNATASTRPLFGPYSILGNEVGFRPTEGLGLQQGDVDLTKRTWLIERNLEKDGSIRPTKTYESRTAGAIPMLVSQQLGHRDMTTTLRCYGEFIPKEGDSGPTPGSARFWNRRPHPRFTIQKSESRLARVYIGMPNLPT